MYNPWEKQTAVSSMWLENTNATFRHSSYREWIWLFQLFTYAPVLLCVAQLGHLHNLKLVQLKVIDTKPLLHSSDITEQNTVGQLSSLPSLPSSYLLPLEWLCLCIAVFSPYHWADRHCTYKIFPTWLFPNSLVWLQSLHPMNCACLKSFMLWSNLQLMGLTQEPRLLTQKILWQTFITNVLREEMQEQALKTTTAYHACWGNKLEKKSLQLYNES